MKPQVLLESQIPAAFIAEVKQIIEDIDVQDASLPQEILEIHRDDYSFYVDYNNTCKLHNFRSYRIHAVDNSTCTGCFLPSYQSQVILALNKADLLAAETAKRNLIPAFLRG
jgi:hypothetical protein